MQRFNINNNNKMTKKKENKYKLGFITKIKNDKIKKGINKNTIINISKKRNEPYWMLKLRLKAFFIWKKMKEPKWFNGKYKKINYNNYIYYSAPKKNKKIKKEIKKTFNKIGIDLNNKKKKNDTAIDAVFDSVSVKTTYKKKLLKLGIIFCSIKEAIKKYPKLVKKYICKVVPINDNFFSALNCSVLSDGTFIYIPKNTICPINLSSYFRINNKYIGQFERTLIILKKNSYLNYMEGCSAPERKINQLHAAVVEIIIYENSEIKYSTIQNWFSGNKNNKGGIYNIVTKRALCKGKKSKISWIQIEKGANITWKYPSSILLGDKSKSNFYSLSLTKFYQQADTGTKMIHIGKKTKSVIIAKSIAQDNSRNTHRSIVKINKNSIKSKNFTQCDSLIIGKNSSTYTIPNIISKNKSSKIEHEAFSSYIKEKQIFFLLQRGINKKKAIHIILNIFSKKILDMLPMEYSLELQNNLFNHN